MVAHLLKLKIDLLRNSIKRTPWQLVGLILGGLYGLGMLVMILVGLAALGAADTELIGTILVLAGAALFVGWLVIPVVLSGLDMTLDPARFTTYAIPMRSLLAGLALSSFIGIPGLITLVAAMGTAAAYWRHPVAAAAALVCGALAALTCVVASRAITAASTSLASSRRFKDVSGIVMLVPLMLLGPIMAGITTGLNDFSSYLPKLANTLSWTPLGAVWAVPADIARGAFGPAALKFLIALATLAVLAWIWKVCLAKALVTPAYGGSTSRSAGKMGFFGVFPQTPAGAVAARCLTYWFRDPRYSAGLIIAPLLPLVLVFAASQAGGLASMGLILGYGGAFAAFLVAWSISSDISYDNTAFALHLATGLSGRDDRTGRVMAAAVLALPLGLLFTLAGAIASGDWAAYPGMLGLMLAATGAGLGLASVFSAQFTMNVPLPGESPMKAKPGNSFFATLVQMGGFFGAAVLAAPVAVFLVIDLVQGQTAFAWAACAVGAVLAVVYVLVGIKVGAALYNKRAPELLLAVSVDR
ncbi:ABC-2 type transport system permease protein [Arthrobacter stackebrandtii]|uniref:ABC-2 type transport system permease protein n=1 Tax=Arthrobacter stackebrandtii TaxID=272161 RepID=A0ABS4YZB3_9MICC|nr:ABC-2 type transport system permease protein [Arthrobacter stackebrandtii]PYH00476.1 transporter [Arthrobacter stackebrandtii]